MLEINKNGYYIINKPNDLYELKSRNSFVFTCTKCDKTQYVTNYRPCMIKRFSQLLCAKCHINKTYTNKTLDEKQKNY